jgi:hypothetical protein
LSHDNLGSSDHVTNLTEKPEDFISKCLQKTSGLPRFVAPQYEHVWFTPHSIAANLGTIAVFGDSEGSSSDEDNNAFFNDRML